MLKVSKDTSKSINELKESSEQSNKTMKGYTIALLAFSLLSVVAALVNLSQEIKSVFVSIVIVMLLGGCFIVYYLAMSVGDPMLKKFSVKELLIGLFTLLVVVLGILYGNRIVWIILFFVLSIGGIKYVKPPWLKTAAKILIILLLAFFLVTFTLVSWRII